MEPSIFKMETDCWLDAGEGCFRQAGKCRFLDKRYGCLIAAYLKCKHGCRAHRRMQHEEGVLFDQASTN